MTAEPTHSPAEPRALVDAPEMTLAERVEARASELYAQGFHCGESVFMAVNEVAPAPVPSDVLRVTSGFCEGIGGSRCICGAAAGGVMAIGLLSGRQGVDDPWEPSYYASAELRRLWVEDQHAESCDEVVARIGGMRLPQRWAHCTLLVGRTARWVVEIGEREGWL